MREKDENALLVFERKVLRKIYGPYIDEHTGEWRILKNKELQDLYQRPSIKEDITKRRLKWAGHSWRKTGSLIKIVQENAPKGKRPLGRPRLRWEDRIKEDLEKVRPGLDWKETINSNVVPVFDFPELPLEPELAILLENDFEVIENLAYTEDAVSTNTIRTNKNETNKSDKKKWSRAVRKERTLNLHRGLPYVNSSGKEVTGRQMQPLKSCRKKCIVILTNDIRSSIFNEYWSLGDHEKRVNFISSLINSADKKLHVFIYEREFHKLKLSFKKPKVDTCHKCDTLQMQIKTAEESKNEDMVITLALKLSESLLNSPNLSSHTATSLQNIIESSILSLLPARCPSVQHLLASSKCSVALISETWLSPSRNFHIPHFNIFRADQQDGYGGTAIATHSSLKVRPIELNPYLQRVFSVNKINIVGIEVLNIKNHPSISFWSCYIPGDSMISLDVWDSLFKLGTNNFFFGGDFNAHHPAWGSTYTSRRGNIIHDTINSLDLSVLNTGTSTHLGRPNSPNSAIDISFSSPNLIWSTTWHTLTDPHGSDHFPIIITFNYNTHNRGYSSILQDTPSPTLQFNLNRADWNQFSQTISNNMSPIEATICPLEAYNQFCQLILTAAKQSILHKNQTKENFAPSPPWWDSNCTQAIKLRKHLFKIYRLSGSPSDYYNYNNSRAATTRLLKNKKRIAWKQFCSNLNPSSSLQDLWKTTKRFRKCIQPSTHTLNDDCLARFIGQIYQSFNNKEYFVSTFIDIRGAFDSVHIPSLISHLKSLNIPSLFINFISLLFSDRKLHFRSSFGSTNIRSTSKGLPQGSCLSPILFNLYMSFIIKHLNTLGHNCLVYADDIVIFSHNRSIDVAVTSMNNALDSLQNALNSSFFSIAHNKCKAVIFTRRRLNNFPDITIKDFIIPIVTNHTYLGLKLDSKFRWAPHVNDLTKFCARWANFLRSVANVWWGSHPTPLLLIYKSVIRSKLDYGCFFSSSSALFHRNKIQKLQTSCLRSILGALKSTPSAAIDIEAVCQPLELRCKLLAGKFLLRDLYKRTPCIFNTFIDVFFAWRYVNRSVPVLVSVAHSLSTTKN
ncbi:hypothetical protein QTP88_000730 [Uroleucon formosanum]